MQCKGFLGCSHVVAELCCGLMSNVYSACKSPSLSVVPAASAPEHCAAGRALKTPQFSSGLGVEMKLFHPPSLLLTSQLSCIHLLYAEVPQ